MAPVCCGPGQDAVRNQHPNLKVERKVYEEVAAACHHDGCRPCRLRQERRGACPRSRSCSCAGSCSRTGARAGTRSDRSSEGRRRLLRPRRAPPRQRLLRPRLTRAPLPRRCSHRTRREPPPRPTRRKPASRQRRCASKGPALPALFLFTRCAKPGQPADRRWQFRVSNNRARKPARSAQALDGC